MGTPTDAYDANGKHTWSCELNSYGKVRNEWGTKKLVPFRYQGQYEDSDTGLYYNRFRYYDSTIGNYISQDPIGLEGGITLYNYVHDTNSWIDIFGTKPLSKDYYTVNGNLKRYNGKKPTYTVNPKHVNQRTQKGSKVSALPSDAEQVFAHAVPNTPFNKNDNGTETQPTAWYGKNEKGEIYRFSVSNGEAHYSGKDTDESGIKNMSDYAKERLNKSCGEK